MTTQPTTKPLLLLITQDPSQPLACHALRFAKSALKRQEQAGHEKTEQKDAEQKTGQEETGKKETGQQLAVFFYANGATTANAFRWQSADQINIGKQWSQLAKEYGLELAVCVSTALARGVTDEDNGKRHELIGNGDTKHGNASNFSDNTANYIASNIADGFRLVGLSELVMKMSSHKVIQF